MNKFYFYTETAFHHQGDMEYIKKLIIASKESGANGIKFQVLTHTADFISTKHSAFKDLATWSFNEEEWRQVFLFTQQQQLDIIMMPLNIDSLILASEFPVKFLEIHSVSFNDKELHQAISASGIDLIIGVGGRTMEEIDRMQQYFGHQLKVLMTGFQSFPSKLEEVKLGRITDLQQRFPTMLVGYADHSSFDNEFAVIANDYAFLLGARIFEKHITVDEGVERVDFSAAVAPGKIKESIRRLHFLSDYVLVNPELYTEFNEPETRYRNRQLICVAARTIGKGETITEKDLALKLIDCPEKTFSKKEEVTGKTAQQSIEADAPVLFNDIA